MFSFFGNIIKQILHYFILLILFFRKNVLKFGIACFLGAVLGYILEKQEGGVYESRLFLKINFGGYSNMTSNIDYYNSLLSSEDSDLFAEEFGITEQEVLSIKKIEIEKSIVSKTESLKNYNSYFKKVDTILKRELPFEDYLNYEDVLVPVYCNIRVKSTDVNVFKKLTKTMVNSLENNVFLRNKKHKTNEMTAFLLNSYSNSLTEIDNINEAYRLALSDSYSENNTDKNTPLISLQGNDNVRNLDLKTFGMKDRLLEKIDFEKYKMMNSSSIVDVISDFNKRGALKKAIKDKKMFNYSILAFLGVFCVLVLLEFDKYLKNYKGIE